MTDLVPYDVPALIAEVARLREVNEELLTRIETALDDQLGLRAEIERLERLLASTSEFCGRLQDALASEGRFEEEAQ